MKPFRKNDGLTLVELLVTIAIGSIVTLAATTVLLLGLRINRQSTETVQHQTTARILLSTLEDIASEGSIKKLNTGPDSWQVCSESKEENGVTVDTVLVAYDSAECKIYTGGTAITSATDETVYNKNGTTIMEGIIASHASLDGQLLTFAIETEEGSYTSAAYCRMAPDEKETDTAGNNVIDKLQNENIEDDETVVQGNTSKARAEFLKVLTSQRGSPGLILEEVKVGEKTVYLSAGRYYSQWYNGGVFSNGWNKDTPWCACFIVWALEDKVSDYMRTPLTRAGQSGVDNFIAYLQKDYKEEANDLEVEYWYPCELRTKTISNKTEIVSAVENSNYQIIPGDLIFFDWTVDDVYDADHVGAVLSVDSNYIYTIEGNSADMVAVRRYTKDDPRIMGYGVLDWKTNSELNVAQ